MFEVGLVSSVDRLAYEPVIDFSVGRRAATGTVNTHHIAPCLGGTERSRCAHRYSTPCPPPCSCPRATSAAKTSVQKAPPAGVKEAREFATLPIASGRVPAGCRAVPCRPMTRFRAQNNRRKHAPDSVCRPLDGRCSVSGRRYLNFESRPRITETTS